MATDPNTGLPIPTPAGASAGVADPATASPTATRVNKMLTSGDPYVDQAKAAGTDYAATRGLLNSSIAAGASQKAAYDAVVPIATNDANIQAGKDLSEQNYTQTAALQGGQIASAEKIANLSAATQTSIANLNIDAAAKQQTTQIIADAAKQAAQISSDQDLAALNAKTQETIAGLNIDAAAKQQLQQLASTELIASNQNATNLNIAGQNVAANAQDKSAAAAVSYANTYAGMVTAINNNTAMPADARAAALDNAKTLYNNGMNLVQQTYNVQLDWGQNAPVPPAPANTDTTSAAA